MARLITSAQFNVLYEVPRSWQPMPLLSDSRSIPPLVKGGFIEIKNDVVEDHGPVRFVSQHWRITEAGEAQIRKAAKKWNLGLLYENFVPYDVEEKESTDDD